MTSDFVKLFKKSAKDEAIKIARKVREESGELVTPKIFKKDTKSGSGQEMSMMQQVMTGDGKIGEVAEGDKLEEEVRAQRRIKELEVELAEWREKRLKKEAEWSKDQEEIMGAGDKETSIQEQPLIIPTSPQKGPRVQAPGQSKKGTMEEGRTKKG